MPDAPLIVGDDRCQDAKLSGDLVHHADRPTLVISRPSEADSRAA
jgi:hypothetical protein